MNKLLLAAALTGALLSGCATTYPAVSAYPPPAEIASDEIDLQPPVPSFTTVADCELAYGVGACGTGAALYQTAGIMVPVDAYGWYAPYAFGVMTGVLVNHYFAPPGVYVAGVQYRSFTSTTVVNSYKVINQTTINNFKQAPLSARNQALRSGPVGYSQSRGLMTGAARFAGTASGHAQSSSYAKSANVSTQRPSSAATTASYSQHSTPRATASTKAASTYTPSRPPSSANSYSPPTRAASTTTPQTRGASTSTPPTRTAAPSYTAPHAAQPANTSPRPATTYSAPAKVCKTSPCR
jgi:hypothetical protein